MMIIGENINITALQDNFLSCKAVISLPFYLSNSRSFFISSGNSE